MTSSQPLLARLYGDALPTMTSLSDSNWAGLCQFRIFRVLGAASRTPMFSESHVLVIAAKVAPADNPASSRASAVTCQAASHPGLMSKKNTKTYTTHPHPKPRVQFSHRASRGEPASSCCSSSCSSGEATCCSARQPTAAATAAAPAHTPAADWMTHQMPVWIPMSHHHHRSQRPASPAAGRRYGTCCGCLPRPAHTQAGSKKLGGCHRHRQGRSDRGSAVRQPSRKADPARWYCDALLTPSPVQRPLSRPLPLADHPPVRETGMRRLVQRRLASDWRVRRRQQQHRVRWWWRGKKLQAGVCGLVVRLGQRWQPSSRLRGPLADQNWLHSAAAGSATLAEPLVKLLVAPSSSSREQTLMTGVRCCCCSVVELLQWYLLCCP